MLNQYSIHIRTSAQDRRGNSVDLPLTIIEGQIQCAELIVHYRIESPESAPISVRTVPDRGIAAGDVLMYAASPGDYCVKNADGGFTQGSIDAMPEVELHSRFALEQDDQILWCYLTTHYQLSRS